MDYIQRARRVVEIETAELTRLVERIDSNFEAAIRLIQTTLETNRKLLSTEAPIDPAPPWTIIAVFRASSQNATGIRGKSAATMRK